MHLRVFEGTIRVDIGFVRGIKKARPWDLYVKRALTFPEVPDQLPGISITMILSALPQEASSSRPQAQARRAFGREVELLRGILPKTITLLRGHGMGYAQLEAQGQIFHLDPFKFVIALKSYIIEAFAFPK